MEKKRLEMLLPRGMSRREFARLLGASGLFGGGLPLVAACGGESAEAEARMGEAFESAQPDVVEASSPLVEP